MTSYLRQRIEQHMHREAGGILSDDKLKEIVDGIESLVDESVGIAITEAMELGDILDAVGLTIIGRRRLKRKTGRELKIRS